MIVLFTPARLLVLGAFAIGWYVSRAFATGQLVYYTLLTAVAAIAATALMAAFNDRRRMDIHLIIISVVFVVGYFVKFYVLCYMADAYATYGTYMRAVFPRETVLLRFPEIVLAYFEVTTAALVALALAVFAVRRYGPPSPQRGMSPTWVPSTRILRPVFIISVLAALFLGYIQLALGIGFVSGADRQRGPLPYRLAGIATALQTILVPMLFLFTVWLADRLRERRLTSISTMVFLLVGVANGLISTSKAPLLAALGGLAVLWHISATLTTRRTALLIISLAFGTYFNTALMQSRVLRAASDRGVLDIALDTINPFGKTDTMMLADEVIVSPLGILMRVNGADALLNIVADTPPQSIGRTWDVLVNDPDDVDTIYSRDVLRRPSQPGLAFSPSLLGFFRLVLGRTAYVCLGVVIFVLGWHLCFVIICRFCPRTQHVILAALGVTVAMATSEGSLQALPRTLAVFATAAALTERLARTNTLTIARAPLARLT